MNDPIDMCLAASLRSASTAICCLASHGSTRHPLYTHAYTDLVLVFGSPISFRLKTPLPSQFSQPMMALASLRFPRLSSGGRTPWPQIDAKGGDELEAATAYLARKLVFRPYR